MQKIWKFDLFPFGIIKMPVGSKVLTVQSQQEKPCIWALVNPKNKPEKRIFNIYGTGHNVPDDPGEYIGTFQLQSGSLVFHVFEMKDRG